jgi:hypothetical protein
MHKAIMLICTLLFLAGCEKSAPTTSLSSQVDLFMAQIHESFRTTPASRYLSVDTVSNSLTLNNEWKLTSKDNWGRNTSGIIQLFFLSNQTIIKNGGENGMILNLKVFNDATSAREWALQTAFAGAAPTNYLLERNKKYFGQKNSPGEFCFGPHLFVRGNVVVEFGSDANMAASQRVDNILKKEQDK